MYSIIIMAILLALWFIGAGLFYVGAPFYMLFTGSTDAGDYLGKAPLQIITMCREMMLTESGYGIVGTIAVMFGLGFIGGLWFDVLGMG